MIQDRVGVCVGLRHIPICVMELVLESGVSTLPPDLDGRCGFHMFDDRGVLGEHEQR